MKRAEHQPEQVDISTYAGVFVKLWSVSDAGTLLPQHAHEYDHITMIVRGSVKVWCEDAQLADIFRAPAIVQIPANALHNFLTITPDVVLACIHNGDRIEGDEPAVAQHATLELED